MSKSERKFVELVFLASSKYGSWDPEVLVEAGDWGRIASGRRGWKFWRSSFWNPKGIFFKEGNIYKDGRAKQYDIAQPMERGIESHDGVSWITSNNATQMGADAALGGFVQRNTFRITFWCSPQTSARFRLCFNALPLPASSSQVALAHFLQCMTKPSPPSNLPVRYDVSSKMRASRAWSSSRRSIGVRLTRDS